MKGLCRGTLALALITGVAAAEPAVPVTQLKVAINHTRLLHFSRPFAHIEKGDVDHGQRAVTTIYSAGKTEEHTSAGPMVIALKPITNGDLLIQGVQLGRTSITLFDQDSVPIEVIWVWVTPPPIVAPWYPAEHPGSNIVSVTP
jgi:Pilus formation protein N terminal region